MPRKTVLIALVAALLVAAPALAVVAPDRDAAQVAASMSEPLPPGAFAGAAFVTIPDGGRPAGVVTPPPAIPGFPTSGGSFAVLSTGDAQILDAPNDSQGSGVDNAGGSGDPSHGASVFDLVTLRVDLNVPADRNCLRLDLRFLSEEFPENVGGTVNDAFVAELDTSDFTIDANAAVSAPHNFAFDSAGNLISVNTAAFSDAEAAGTTFDGATPVLRASTPVSPGAHSIFLSIFDQGDGILDSAALIDALRLDAAQDCRAGAVSDVTPPAVTLTSPANGSTLTTPPTYAGGAGAAAGDGAQVTVRTFAGGAATGTPVQTTTANRSGASWSVAGGPLAPGTYTAVAGQADDAGNAGSSAASTFTIVPPPVPPIDLAPPVTGKSVNVGLVKGKVTITLPNGKKLALEDAAHIPTGSTVDTRSGTVRLTSTSQGGKTQNAQFFDGLFKVTQTKGKKPITDLKLNERLAKCPSKGSKKAQSSARRKKRRLWGDGKGNFRTSGRRSAATVSGTKWLVEDSCKGTLTRVARGKVKVRDFGKKKTVIVKAGKRYLAR